ncbi:NAD(P)H-hydrate dehydratase [Ligilactobacillus ceti]|nr:NAD(P)H-hydrate dehydratase [Ligilactobacillus ceti]
MILTTQCLTNVIKKRPTNSHKGTFGRVLLIGGSLQYGGAILLATKAAVRAGAGLVTCATDLINRTALNTTLPEAMFINYLDFSALKQQLSQADVVVIGPGLGLSAEAFNIFKITCQQINSQATLVIDGSALTFVAQAPSCLQTCATQKIILTPHLKEWERITNLSLNQQSIINNQKAQQKLSATVVLKGATTTIYYLDGHTATINIGGPYMATGGTGDTLTGIIAAFLAQFKEPNPKEVLAAAVFLHSYIPQQLSQHNYVVLPSEISNHLPNIMQKFSS